MIPKYKKNKNSNIQKTNSIGNNKAKTIQKKYNYISKNNFDNNTNLINYNNSIEVVPKKFKKIKIKNKNSVRNIPILSERIKKNSISKNRQEEQFDSIPVEKNNTIYNINKTDNNNSFNQMKMLELNNMSVNSYFTDNNIKNIYDQNVIINNNNFDQKKIFFGENDKYNNINNKNNFNEEYSYYIPNNYINNFKSENSFFNQYNNKIFKNNNNNIRLKLSELSINNNNFKNRKDSNKMKNSDIIKENINLNAKLNKFIKENFKLKIRMNSLQNRQKENRNINKCQDKNDEFFKHRKYLSYKRSLDFFNNFNYNQEEDLDEDEYNSQTTKKKLKIEYDNEPKKENNHQMNTIYDSMQFKIKKRNLSYNYNNINSINMNNRNNNNNKISLMKDSYQHINKNILDKENYFEESKISKYNEKEIENNRKEDSIEMDQICDLETSHNLIDTNENGQLKQKINFIQKESEKLNNKYKLLTKETSELQEKYNLLYNNNELVKKKNEIYLKCIDEQQKKIKSYEQKIHLLENEINTKFKKSEEELKNKLDKANEIIIEKDNQIKTIQKNMQNMKNENYSLHKFKSDYNDKEIELIEVKNELRKLENLNNKYDTLKFNYDELIKQNNELKKFENQNKILLCEFDKLKESENKYKELNEQYKEIMKENDELKQAQKKEDELNERIKNYNELKMKYDKINEENIKLKEIRGKYHNLLKEQNDLLIIQNRYNDLIGEVQDLKEYKIKYESLLYNKGIEINSTEIERQLAKKIDENKLLTKKLEDICINQNLVIVNNIEFSFKK